MLDIKGTHEVLVWPHVLQLLSRLYCHNTVYCVGLLLMDYDWRVSADGASCFAAQGRSAAAAGCFLVAVVQLAGSKGANHVLLLALEILNILGW